MEVAVDAAGRILLPMALRDRVGLAPGSMVDVSAHGNGLHVAPVGRTARLEHRDGMLVAVSETSVTDEDVFGLLDSIRG